MQVKKKVAAVKKAVKKVAPKKLAKHLVKDIKRDSMDIKEDKSLLKTVKSKMPIKMVGKKK